MNQVIHNYHYSKNEQKEVKRNTESLNDLQYKERGQQRPLSIIEIPIVLIDYGLRFDIIQNQDILFQVQELLPSLHIL